MKLKFSIFILLSAFSANALTQSQLHSAASHTKQQVQASAMSSETAELPTVWAVVEGDSEHLATVSDFDRATIQKAGIQSWQDVTRRLEPGLDFNVQNKSINIRGLDKQRVQLFVDGIPNPWLDDGARGTSGGQQGFSFAGLSSISVLKGTGVKGSASLGSQVAVNSIGFADLLPENQMVGFLGGVTYSGYDDSTTTQLGGAVAFTDSFRAMLYGSYKDFHEVKNMAEEGGYGATRNQTNPQDGHEKNGLVRLEFDINPHNTISLNASTYRSRGTIDSLNNQGTTNYDIGNYTEFTKTDTDRVWLNYDYRNQAHFALLDRISALLYWQNSKIDSGYDAIRNKVTDRRAFIIPGNPFGYGYPYGEIGRSNSVESRLIGGRLEAAGYIGNHEFYSNWLVGMDYQGGRYRQASVGYDNCPVLRPGTPAPFGPRTCDFLHTNQSDVPQVDSDDLGFYLQNTFAWRGDSVKLTPSIRYDYWRRKPKYADGFADVAGGLSDDESIGRSGGRWSPALLLEVNPSAELSLFARYAHGFRAPSATELYQKYGSTINYLRVGNSSLKPETSRGFELGASWQEEQLNASLVFFHQNYKNFIETNLPVAADSPYKIQQQTLGYYPFGAFQAVNLDKARIYGLEANAEYKFSNNVFVRGGLAWTVGKDRENNTHLNSVAPLKSYIGIGYESEQWGADAHLTLVAKRNKVRYKEATAEAPYPDFKAPGYGTLDLGVYYQPSFAKGLRLQANLINAFDKKYWNALNVPTQGETALSRDIDYYSSRGRYGMLSISYQY